MAHWNLRVMQRVVSDDELTHTIHEVYYNDAGVVTGWTENSKAPCGYADTGTTPDASLLDDLKRFQRATTMPVLDWETGLEVG